MSLRVCYVIYNRLIMSTLKLIHKKCISIKKNKIPHWKSPRYWKMWQRCPNFK